MKEEISRILKLVQEGKLSAEDATELIDAFQSSGDDRAVGDEPIVEGEATAESEAKAASGSTDSGSKKDPFKGFADFMNNLEREVRESVDWKEVANQARQGAQKGLDALKKAADEVRAGNVHIGLFGTTEVREVTLPLKVAVGKTLRIENPCGSVRVSGGFKDGTVNAKAKVRGSSVDDAKARAEEYTLVVEESDHTVVIRQPRIAALAVDLVIQLAGNVPVDIKTESGNVQVFDTGAGAKVNSQSGNVQVRGLNGPVDINAQSGDVSVEDCVAQILSIESKSGEIKLTKVDANVNMRIASGDIVLKEVKGKTLSIESVSGNVFADFSEPISGTVNVRTVNGDSTISIPDGNDCRVSLSTLRGDVECGVTLEDEARTDQRITGKLGAGTGSLDVSGINGDISLKLRDATV